MEWKRLVHRPIRPGVFRVVGIGELVAAFFSDDETISKRANELLAVASAGFAHDPIKCLLTGEAKNWITKEGQAALWKIREMTAIT